MRRVKFNALINVFTLIFFILSGISGIIIWVVIPSLDSVMLGGTNYLEGGRVMPDRSFLYFPRDSWMGLHIYSSAVFIILVVSHDVLHLSWFRKLPKILSRKKQDGS